MTSAKLLYTLEEIIIVNYESHPHRAVKFAKSSLGGIGGHKNSGRHYEFSLFVRCHVNKISRAN